VLEANPVTACKAFEGLIVHKCDGDAP